MNSLTSFHTVLCVWLDRGASLVEFGVQLKKFIHRDFVFVDKKLACIRIDVGFGISLVSTVDLTDTQNTLSTPCHWLAVIVASQDIRNVKGHG